MKRVAGLATLGLLLGLAPASAVTLDDLDARLAAGFAKGQVPGAQVALIEHGQVVFLKSYGVSDTAAKTPVTDDTVFRAGSISKSITGIAVMTLVEQKKLSLDAKLADLAPEVSFVNPWEKTDPIRLVHLLEHTTGWPDISTRVLAQDGPGWSTLKGVQFTMREFTSRWAPGHFAVYNNAGPAVAGVILEKASGQTFGAYVDEHVLRPMGMATADFDLTPGLATRVAKSYAPDGSVTPFQNIILPPAGSLNVNASELAQLVRFFLGRGTVDGRRILEPASVDRIERSESNLASKDGFVTGYGLGNAPFTGDGIVFRGHNGGIDSFTSVYGYQVACGCGYVMMANGGEGVDFGTTMSEEVERYLTRGMTCACTPTAPHAPVPYGDYAGFYRTITPPNNLLKPLIDIIGISRVSAGENDLVIASLGGSAHYHAVTPRIFQRQGRDTPGVAFAEENGRMYRLTFLNAHERISTMWAVAIMAFPAIVLLGLVFALIMTIPWLISLFRGRLHARGGWAVRFVPLLAIVACLTTFGMAIYGATGSGTSALRALAGIGPYSLTIFVASLLFPLLAALGLWLALTRRDVPIVVRTYATLVCAALLAFSAYAVLIGWIGARTWTM